MERLLIWMGVSLILLGLLIAGAGFLLGLAGGRGGRLLPGDIVISRPGFTFIFPLTTAIAASLVLTLVLWLISLLRR